MFTLLAITLLVSHPVTPVQTYNSVNDGIAIRVKPGDGIEVIRAVLLDNNNKPLSPIIKISTGTHNLVTKMPQITDLTRAAWLQIFIFDVPVQSPLVIQPMKSRETPLVEESLRPDGENTYTKIVGWEDEAEEDELKTPFISGWRVYMDHDAIIETSEGTIRVALRPDSAPNTVWNFRELIKGNFYDNTTFHRIVPMTSKGHPFVIQGGDPTGTGYGGPGYWLPIENSDLQHDFGVLSMARAGNPDSAGSQFFLCLSREGTARLDGQYCSFGETIEGGDVIRKIAATPLADPASGKPSHPPVIRSITLVPATFRHIEYVIEN
jgi:peptidyl-prolyl cis-trans isomerase B (cyclophilin B)